MFKNGKQWYEMLNQDVCEDVKNCKGIMQKCYDNFKE